MWIRFLDPFSFVAAPDTFTSHKSKENGEKKKEIRERSGGTRLLLHLHHPYTPFLSLPNSISEHRLSSIISIASFVDATTIHHQRGSSEIPSPLLRARRLAILGFHFWVVQKLSIAAPSPSSASSLIHHPVLYWCESKSPSRFLLNFYKEWLMRFFFNKRREEVSLLDLSVE
ncbi:hypothetical protein L1887_35078 [Cichorium endivia]|nr:hypothetical protein L1887_35078 [Cichorium endivia]